MEDRKDLKIPGYVHPDNTTSLSNKNTIYKLFNENTEETEFKNNKNKQIYSKYTVIDKNTYIICNKCGNSAVFVGNDNMAICKNRHKWKTN